MDNLIIPNPIKLEIVYVDAKGKETTRTVAVLGQDRDNIRTYCYHSHGIRTFKKNSIKSVTSVS